MSTRRIISTSPQDAADKLGRHVTTIYRRCEQKKMAAVKEGRDWRVFLLELDQGGKPIYFSLPYTAVEKILGQAIASIVEEV